MCVRVIMVVTRARATLEARCLLQKMEGEGRRVGSVYWILNTEYWILNTEYHLQTDPAWNRELRQGVWTPRLPWRLHQNLKGAGLDSGYYRGHSMGLWLPTCDDYWWRYNNKGNCDNTFVIRWGYHWNCCQKLSGNLKKILFLRHSRP